MGKNTKTVIIGLDGVPFGMIKDFAGNGVMPNTQQIIEDGLFVEMRSSVPEISSVAWSSIITGKNPGDICVMHDFLWMSIPCMKA